MKSKRRDHKNRVLRSGEYQDADGRYRYTFTENKKRHVIYSWRLVKTDPLPDGKRECVPLRDQIEEIRKLKDKGVLYGSGQMTVLELVAKYLKTKTGVKESTKAGYKTVVNVLKNDPFGSNLIHQVKLSDTKVWMLGLQDAGKGYSSIQSIRGVLRPAFQMAVDDDLLVKNPFEWQLATVIVNDSVTREAITQEQERKFLNFVREDKHYCRYYDGMCLLFKTGLRISEFCGLTINNIDLKNRKIIVDHQLQRRGDMRYYVESTKTGAGTRTLPMTDDVYECCKRILESRPKPQSEPMVDGYTGFLFLDKNGMPTVALHWEHYFSRAVGKYNKIYRIQMPKITPHVCRHTYCSNMARSGMTPKTLQYLMGHSEISVTLNVYTHLGEEDAQAELERLELAGTSKSHRIKQA